MTTDSLLNEAHRLSVAERLRLVEEIWDSIDENPAALLVTAEQRDELDRRLADYEANPDAAVSWDEARRRIGHGVRLPF